MSEQHKSTLSPPPPAPKDVQGEYARAKQELEEAFKEFHQKYFLSKVLEENKSTATKKTEQAAVDRLIKAAVTVDSLNANEGSLALMIISIREQLAMRDRVNHLEYELCRVMRDMDYLKKELGVANVEQKKQ